MGRGRVRGAVAAQHLVIVALLGAAGLASFARLGGAMEDSIAGDASGGVRPSTAPAMTVSTQAGSNEPEPSRGGVAPGVIGGGYGGGAQNDGGGDNGGARSDGGGMAASFATIIAAGTRAVISVATGVARGGAPPADPNGSSSGGGIAGGIHGGLTDGVEHHSDGGGLGARLADALGQATRRVLGTHRCATPACVADSVKDAAKDAIQRTAEALGGNPPRRRHNSVPDPDRSPYIRTTDEAFREMRSKGMRDEWDSEALLLEMLDEGVADDRLEDAVFMGLLKHYGYDTNDLKDAETDVQALRDQFASIRSRCGTDACRDAVDEELARRERYVHVNAQSPELVLVDGDDEKKTESAEEYRYVGSDLFVDGVSSADVEQGNMGDCYFLAALAALAEADPDFIKDGIRDNHDGTYSVRFFSEGKAVWVDVTPEITPDAASTKPEVSKSDEGELWVALYEKAYAQWRGSSYADIYGGTANQASLDLTGSAATTEFNDTDFDAVLPGDQASGARDIVRDTLIRFGGSAGAISPITVDEDDDVLADVKERVGKLPTMHMYYVTDADEDHVYLGNPWGSHYAPVELTWEEYFHLCPAVTYVGA